MKSKALTPTRENYPPAPSFLHPLSVLQNCGKPGRLLSSKLIITLVFKLIILSQNKKNKKINNVCRQCR